MIQSDSSSYKIDTIKKIVADPLDYITSVHEFYEDSWTSLLWVLGAAAGLVGIIIPLLVQWIQSKYLNYQKKQLVDESKNLRKSITKDLQKKFDKTIEHKFHDIELQIQNLVSSTQQATHITETRLRADIFFSYGNLLFDKGDRELALYHLINSIQYYYHVGDINQISRVISKIGGSLNGFDPQLLKDMANDSDISFEGLLQIYKEMYENNITRHLVRDIYILLKSIPE